MDSVLLSRIQFGAVTVYHFFFVPLTLGLSWILVYMQYKWVKTNDEKYRKMTKYWGKLFLINFAVGVATGIVQEFQFGMNWSGYSRFVGDIFGAPLAIEALLAFFLESTFLGIWIFGGDRLSKKMHTFSIFMVAVGSNISALWILLANSWMQNPVGYAIQNGRAEMTNFFDIVTNPYIFVHFPHTIFGGLCQAAFVIIGISAWQYYLKGKKEPFLKSSMKIGAVVGLVATIMVSGVGHQLAVVVFKYQPMKMAAAEGQYEDESPAPTSLFSLFDEEKNEETFAIKVPYVTTVLLYGSMEGEVKGMNTIQKEYEEKYGPGEYRPPVAVTFWSFKAMLGAGVLMMLLSALLVFIFIKKKEVSSLLAKILVWSISLPYIANAAGWMMSEMGRQPWAVQGVLKVQDSGSPSLHPGEVWFSLLAFVALYAFLLMVAIKLFKRAADQTDVKLDEGGY